MEKEYGKEIRIEVEGTVEDYAMLLLHLTNWRCNENSGVVDVRTVAGSDMILVTCGGDVEQDVISLVERHGATHLDSEDIVIYIVGSPDFSDEMQEDIDKHTSVDYNVTPYYIHNEEDRY